MTLRVANFWSNFSYSSFINTPNGCLLNAEGSGLIFFERCNKSPQNNTNIFTHSFTFESQQGADDWKPVRGRLLERDVKLVKRIQVLGK